MGLVTEDLSSEAMGRRKLMDAGFGHVEATAALEKSHGDPDKAFELLATGWTPDFAMPNQPPSSSGCPFLQNSAAIAGPSASSRCPFLQSREASAGPLSPDRPVAGPLSSSGAQVCRVLGNSMQEEPDGLLNEDPHLI